MKFVRNKTINILLLIIQCCRVVSCFLLFFFVEKFLSFFFSLYRYSFVYNTLKICSSQCVAQLSSVCLFSQHLLISTERKRRFDFQKKINHCAVFFSLLFSLSVSRIVSSVFIEEALISFALFYTSSSFAFCLVFSLSLSLSLLTDSTREYAHIHKNISSFA